MPVMVRNTRASGATKREATYFEGLPTPNESMSTDGTLTPPKEELDEKDLISNIAKAPSFRSNDGLPKESAALEAIQAAARKARSPSPSLESNTTSFRLPSAPAVDPTSARRSALPRPSMAPSLVTSVAPMARASLEIVGEKVDLLVKAIEELRQLGLRELDTELPELVLVGDQSAGKSSLMGAIAEINLPKDTGMCTRCPSNIRTAPAPEWKCIVSLHENYHFTTDNRRKPTSHNPFPPWVQNDDLRPVIRPFAETKNKNDLEVILRWAQLALLNPSTDHHAFIPGTGSIAQNGFDKGHKHEADFSPNIIAIEIFGPRLPALSFYDLPGIFATADHDEKRYLIKVFELLARKYISHENALIICAMTMGNDPGNSNARNLLDDAKADKRSIGVLTMPDLLQEGSRHLDYDRILKGESYAFPRGYYVTKQPDQTFRPGTVDYHVKAREEEEAFFDNNARWTGDWAKYRHRCGTKAIQGYLSQEFARLISKSMPNIDEKIKSQAELVDEKLRNLPELPIHNVQNVVRQCLQEFSNGVRSLLEGGQSNDFLSSWSVLSTDFGQAIHQMKPMFGFSHPSDVIKGPAEIINLDDDSDCDTVTSVQRSGAAKRKADFMSPMAKRQLNDTPIPFNPNRGFGEQQPKSEAVSPGSSIIYHNTAPSKRPTAFDAHLGAGKGFMSLAGIRSVINKHRRPGHPDNVTDAAREEICLRSVRPWKGPLEALSSTTYRQLKEAILANLNRCLGAYKQTDLYKQSKIHIIEFLEMHRREQDMYLVSFYDLERYRLFTINDEAFKRYKAEELKILQDRRRGRRALCLAEKRIMSGEQKGDLKKVAAGIKDDELGPDPFAQEIDLAAYVRGYYRTAGVRFADNLCQNIQGMLFRKVHDEIAFLLEGLLGINDGDSETICRNLMVENHDEARERAALQIEKEKLTKAAEQLAKLVRDLNPPTAQDTTIDEDDENNDLTLRPHYSQPIAESVDGEDIYN